MKFRFVREMIQRLDSAHPIDPDRMIERVLSQDKMNLPLIFGLEEEQKLQSVGEQTLGFRHQLLPLKQFQATVGAACGIDV